jgi:uncharacterized protein YlxW (UPF0749 family)
VKVVERKTNIELSQEVKQLREEVEVLTFRVNGFQSVLAKYLEVKQNGPKTSR